MTQAEFDSIEESDLVVVRWPYGGYIAPIRNFDNKFFVEAPIGGKRTEMCPVRDFKGADLVKNPYNRVPVG